MENRTVLTRCECQAELGAELDREGCVVAGVAVWPRSGETQAAPAQRTSMVAGRMDVAWLCPFCGRNALRSFQAPVVAAAGA